jgi:hypothetical protein
MSFSALSAMQMRFAGLKFSLVLLPLVSLLLPATVSAQSTFSGGAASVTTSAVATSTVDVTGATGTVKTVSVELDGVKSDGLCNAMGTVCFFSLQEAEFLLSAPNGDEFVLLSSTGDGEDGCDGNPNQSAACNGLQGTAADKITVVDTGGAAPYDVGWLTGSMPYTVKPSSYWDNNLDTFPPLPGSDIAGDLPQTDGCSNPFANPGCTAQTLNGAFLDAGADGTWTLTLIDNDSPVDPFSITGWKLTLTYNVGGAAATTTAISPSANPATYANSASTASVNFTVTVSTTSSGAPTGTVAFSANGATISGCGAVTLAGSGNSSTATCTGAALAQGNNSISAVYTSNNTGSFGNSSNSMTELVEVTPANPTGDQWCNNSIISDPIGGAVPLAYPSVIKINDAAYNSKTVSTVTVNLEGVAGSVDGIAGQFLLVAPGGGTTHNLDFLDNGWGDPGRVSAVNLTFQDLPTPNYVPNSTTLGDQPTISNPYSATDDEADGNPDTFPASLSPAIDTSIPAVAGTINFPPPYGTGNTEYTHTNVLTFGEAFNGAPANGAWSLYTVSDEPLTVNTGWCITLTLNTGNATTTVLSSTSNPATTGSAVTFTATVQSGGNPVTSGTVTFLDNDAVPAGTTGGNNVVSLNGSGVATFTTSSLTEGDHTITASYSGTASDNSSFSSVLNQRINTATTATQVSATQWQYCDPGAIQILQGTDAGPLTPNPSNIFVTNLPGTYQSVGVQLTNFSVGNVGNLDALASLVEGPTGTALDFFSDTTQGSNGNGEATLGNYIFDDGASAPVSGGNVSISPGAYLPTAYESFLSAPDVFTSSASGFYPAPSSFSYAPTNPLGTSQTFADVFPTSINPDGTWSLFFSSGFANKTFGAANGWCVDLNVTPPVIAAPTLAHVGNFSQGQSNAQYTVDITNNGPGSTGDPSGGTYPMKVTDTLPTGLTYSTFSGTNWNCSASGQTVTCTNDSAIAGGDTYPALTIEVNISGTLTGTVTNQITAGGAGAANKNSNTDSATIEVPLAITSASSTTFTVGTAGSFTVTATGNPTPTFSETGALPSGVTLSSAGVLSGTPAAGAGGTYAITITAINGSSPNATQTFTLTVDQAPAITSANNTTFTVSTPGSFSVTGSGFPSPTFSESGNLPSGVTLSSAGVLSGTPSAGAGGTYSFTITASNGVSPSTTQNFTLTVDQASAITSASSTTFTVGTAGSFAVTASGFPSPTLSETGALPSGVTLSSAGILSGTPAAGAGGIYSIAITASNGIGSNATQNFTLTVDQAPAITSASSTTFTAGTAGSFSVTGTGFPSPTFSETGALPSGVIFSSTGVLSGTPTGVGSFLITIAASNGVSPNSTQNFTLTVSPGAASHFGITVPSSAFVNSPFNFVVTAFDFFGNVATGYSGTIHFTSTDPSAVLPANNTLTNGVGTFPATLDTVGNQTVTAADTVTAGLTGTSATIAVTIPNFVVSNADDSGAGSLRQALLDAASTGSGNITFDPTFFATAQTITLSSGTLNMPSHTTISGPTTGSGATLTNLVTVNGAAATTVFTVGSGVAGTAVANLIVTDGSTGTSGGGINNGGTLSVAGSTISGNSVNGGFGGGIANTGTLTLSNTTISGNSASTGQGSGIFNAGTLTVTNSTIAQNSAAGGVGGGIMNVSGTLTVTDSTISGNSSAGGGGIYGVGTTVNLANSIVSGNSADADIDGSFTNNGGNLVGASAINLAPLGNYGGPMQTLIPLPGSPAICDINPSVATGNDQRGLSRTTTYGSVTCQDSGAVQSNYSMTFSTEPPTNEFAATNFAPGVTLDESGNPFVVTATPLPTVTIPLTLNGTGALTGGSVAIDDATGIATYSALQVSLVGNNDTLTASLTLNPAVTPTPLVISATSSQFDVALASTTTVAVNATATFSESAQNVPLSATVTTTSGSVNAGTVTFAVFQGVTQIGAPVTSGTVTSGAANVSFVLPAGTAAGTYTIQATYSGTTTLAASSDNTHTLVVSSATTTTAAASVSTAYNISAQSVTLTATVTSAAGAVNAGTVTFSVLQGVTLVGSAVTSATVANGAASVSYTLPAGTSAGTYTVQAAYSGTASLSASSDASHTLTVSSATTTTAAVNAVATYSIAAQNVMLTATVTSPSGPVNAGTVTFAVLQGATPMGTAVTSATVLNGAASVSYVLPAGTPAGAYTIQAAYSGTVSLSASSDNTHTLTVGKATATVTLGSLTQTYTGSPLSATATTTPTGLTVNFTYSGNPTPPTTVGSYTVIGTISDANYQGSATGTLKINQATATITWTTPAAITYGTALSATQLDASSTVAGTFAYTPIAGTILTAGPHTLSVTLTPTDTVDYTTATVTVSLTVNQATPTITWPTPAAITYGTALSATQLDASSTVAGTFAYNPIAGTVLTAGSHTLSVTLTPTDAVDYTTASAIVTLLVNQATPSITWSTPAPVTYGTALTATQLDATSTVAGSFAYTPNAGTILTAGSHTLSVTLTPTDTVDYTTATATVTLLVNQATPTITWPAPAAITYGTALSATQLDASSTVAGTFAYTPIAGTVLTAGSHTLSVTLTPTDTVDYTTATATVTLVVNQAAPTISWANPAAIVYGTALGATQLDASSTVAGTFAYTPAAGTVLSAGTHTLSVTLTPTDTTDFTTATASVTITVNQAAPSIVWTTPAAIVYGTALSTAQFDATSTVAGAFAYNPAAGTVLTAGPHTLSVRFTPTDTADYTTATASVTITVNQATPTVTWPTPASITYGTALSATQLDASSTVAGAFVYNPVAGTVLTAGSHMLSVTFTPTDTTDYATATASVTLPVNNQPQTITLSAGTLADAAGVTFGVAPLTLSATASSGLPVVFSLISGPATLNGNVLTITGGGSVIFAANQPGNSNYAAAAQVTETIPVNKALPAVAIASSVNPVLVQNGITFTATVTSGAETPTGTVTFLDGTTPLGTGTFSGGLATFATSSLTAGSHSIMAAYGGDTSFLAATSSALTQQVEDFGFTISSQSVTVSPGGTAVFTFTVNPIDGTTFPAAITFTATELPQGASYTFSPVSVTAGQGSTTVTLTIDMPKTQAGINPANLHPNVQAAINSASGKAGSRGKPNPSVASRLAPFALALILLPFTGRIRRTGKRMSRILSMLLLLIAGMAAVAGISGCGSTSGFFAQQQQSYTVTITGTSGALTHSATVTLTVE